MLVTKEFNVSEINKNERIVIYGAGPIGEIILKFLEISGFLNIVFCDENPSKREKKYLGYDVISPQELVLDYLGNIVLLTPMREFFNAAYQLQELGIKNMYNVKSFIEKVDLEGINWELNTVQYLSYCKETYIRELENNSGDIVLRYVDLPITQKCTLLCKDCSNLMQYFKDPINYDIDTILKSVDILERCVDSIVNLTILGGEPFMHKQLDQVLDRLNKCKKIRQILLFTNGTLLPNEITIAAMKKCNILVQISNYGEHSYKIDELIKVLEKENIMYSVVNHTAWNDFGNLFDRGRTENECKLLFKKCRGKRTLSYVQGKLFHCVRSSHRYLLGVSEKTEYVNLLDNNLGINQKRDLIKKLLNNEIFINSCNYCNGFIDSSSTVPVALQAEKTIDMYK